MKGLLVYFATAPERIDAGRLGIPKVQAGDAQMASALNVVYFWAGVIAVIIIVIGGLLYVTSTGEPAKTKRAKDTILYAVVGLFVVIFAFVITQFVLGRF